MRAVVAAAPSVFVILLIHYLNLNNTLKITTRPFDIPSTSWM